MKYVLQLSGTGAILFFGLNMFFFWTMNDYLWLSSLFGGIILFLWGCWIESKQTQPLSQEGWRRRKVKMQSCVNGICLSLIVLIFFVVNYIQSL